MQNVVKPFPILDALTYAPLMHKIEIKNIYQDWNGESVEQIKHKVQDNPYNLRIGLPRVDEQLRNDPIYFVLGYLSYNPVTKDIENREIATYRNTKRVYIGQSPDEYKFADYKLFVDDNIIAKDFITIEDGMSIKQVIGQMANKIEKLQEDVANLKAQLKNETIYK